MGLFLVALNLFGFLISIIGNTFVSTWLYNNTESILMMILFHGWLNTLNMFIINAFKDPTAVLLMAVLPWILTIILLKKYGKENPSKKTRPTM